MTAARKELFRFGPARAAVRGKVSRDEARVVVLWTERGTPRQRSWPNTPAGRAEARAWAKGFAEARGQTAAPVAQRVTLRELWDRYAVVAFPDLGPRSQVLYRDDWRLVEQFFGREAIAEDLSVEQVGQLRARLDRLGYSVASVGRVLQTLKRVMAWGERHEVLGRNRVHLFRYRIPKGKRPESPAEFTADEAAKILGALDPTRATQWRAWVALTLCEATGERENAVLHLRWSDVDLAAGEIHWPAEFNKLGKAWTQPMREGTRRALEVARQWAARVGYAGPWVLPKGSAKGQGETYTAQSLWRALREAEDRAGVKHLPRRAAHGFRRKLVGDVIAETGDALLGLQAVGDSDVRMAKHYAKKRDTRVADAFSRLDQKRQPAAPEAAASAPDHDPEAETKAP